MSEIVQRLTTLPCNQCGKAAALCASSAETVAPQYLRFDGIDKKGALAARQLSRAQKYRFRA